MAMPARSMSANRSLPVSVIFSATLRTTAGKFSSFATLGCRGTAAPGRWPKDGRLKCSSNATMRIRSPGAWPHASVAVQKSASFLRRVRNADF
jgi:hypothetical protein